MPWVRVEYDDILRATEKAVQILIDDEEIWMPTSQLDADYSERVGQGAGHMYVTEWIAREKELD
jgi:hypothetical protein